MRQEDSDRLLAYFGGPRLLSRQDEEFVRGAVALLGDIWSPSERHPFSLNTWTGEDMEDITASMMIHPRSCLPKLCVWVTFPKEGGAVAGIRLLDQTGQLITSVLDTPLDTLNDVYGWAVWAKHVVRTGYSPIPWKYAVEREFRCWHGSETVSVSDFSPGEMLEVDFDRRTILRLQRVSHDGWAAMEVLEDLRAFAPPDGPDLSVLTPDAYPAGVVRSLEGIVDRGWLSPYKASYLPVMG